MTPPNPTPTEQAIDGQRAGTVPARFHLGYRAALDGFRGVAILLVVLTHLDLVNNNYGFIGVDMFFVLSGFLITCLLIQEWDQNSAISLKAFYARRALRLLPALLAVLAAFMVYSALCHTAKQHAADIKETLLALFYSTNWAVALELFRPETLTHTWSLSIEEQFYLLWPAALLWMLRRNSRASLCNFTALGVVLFWLVRFLLYAGTPATYPRLSRGLDTRADSLLAGCVIGIVMTSGLFPASRRLRSALPFGAVASVAALWLIAQFVEERSAFMFVAGWFLISLYAGVLILELVTNAEGWFHWVFTRRPLVYLGTVSYGLYLWHYPVIMVLKEQKAPWAHSRVTSVLISIALTLASYYLLELPCLRWKRLFQKVR